MGHRPRRRFRETVVSRRARRRPVRTCAALEKVDFGLKPTIRLNHAVIYRGRTQGRDFAIVAIKQLYAMHYFHTALDVSVCVTDGTAGRPGFYLLTLKGSHQHDCSEEICVEEDRVLVVRALD